MKVTITAQQLSKKYNLGAVGSGMLRDDISAWWTNARSKNRVGKEAEANHKKHYWALQDINFDINAGDTVGIIGRNGAGKSTLLKILSRITNPISGTVKIRGKIASLLEVGTGFHPELTGRENIFLNGSILGMSRKEIQKKLESIIDFSEVEKYIDPPVKRYSSGMYVRLAFAVAAHLDSDILIVDEVLAVGDAEFQQKCLGKMQEISTNMGRTILFVSHNLPSVRSICKTGILLNAGRISISGPITEVLQEYLSEAGKVNGLQPKITKSNPHYRLVDLKFYNESLDPVNTVLSGDMLMIRVNIQCSRSLKQSIIRLIIKNTWGDIVCVCNNYHSDRPYHLIEGNNLVVCSIPRIPLPAGKYIIDYTLSTSQEVIEDITNVRAFTVENGDFYGTGRLPHLEVNFS